MLINKYLHIARFIVSDYDNLEEMYTHNLPTFKL